MRDRETETKEFLCQVRVLRYGVGRRRNWRDKV